MEADRADAEQKYEEEVGISQSRFVVVVFAVVDVGIVGGGVGVAATVAAAAVVVDDAWCDAVCVGRILFSVRQRFSYWRLLRFSAYTR